jgi:hypothetical protein
MPQDVTSEVAALYDQYLQERAALDPEWATGVGLHQFDDRLTRWDDASYQARAKFVDAWIVRVSGDSLDARLWRNDLLSQQFENRRRDVRTVAPGLPFGTVSALHDMLVKDFAPKAERLANINKRLALIPAMIDEFRPARAPPEGLTRTAATRRGRDRLPRLGAARPTPRSSRRRSRPTRATSSSSKRSSSPDRTAPSSWAARRTSST